MQNMILDIQKQSNTILALGFWDSSFVGMTKKKEAKILKWKSPANNS
jgi:hypothetical protein